jgi:demethylmacrocin O-methyltransferase
MLRTRETFIEIVDMAGGLLTIRNEMASPPHSISMVVAHVTRQTLADVWELYGGTSDKADRHSYIDLYETLFAPYRKPGASILEIGVLNGDSLVAWSKYFPNGDVWGLDVNPCNPLPNGIRVVLGNACSRDVCNQHFANQKFDIIIDDASHILDQQLVTFALYKDHIRPGGVYVIEDIAGAESAEILRNRGFEIHDRRYVNGIGDDILGIWRDR